MSIPGGGQGDNGGVAATTYPEITDLGVLHGARLRTSDGTFLGVIIPADESPDSICSDSGTYGLPLAARSIRNQDCAYGTQFGDRIGFDPDASDPPLIYIDDQVAGRLSSSLFTNIVSPGELLESMGRSLLNR